MDHGIDVTRVSNPVPPAERGRARVCLTRRDLPGSPSAVLACALAGRLGAEPEVVEWGDPDPPTGAASPHSWPGENGAGTSTVVKILAVVDPAPDPG